MNPYIVACLSVASLFFVESAHADPKAASVTRRVYRVIHNDTLSDVLWNQGVSPLYGKKGWVARNKALNPNITDWRRLLPGQELILEMPSENKFVENKNIEIVRDLPAAPSKPEPKPTQNLAQRDSSKRWQLSKEVAVGFQRSNLRESVGLIQTNTNGLWGLPRLSGALKLRQSSSLWSFSLLGNIAKQWPLDGKHFPLTWQVGVDAARDQVIEFSADSAIGLRAGVHVEQISQASPNRVTSSPRFTERETTVLWTRGGADWTSSISSHKTVFSLGFGFTPWARSSFSNNAASIQLLGIKADVAYRFHMTKPVFLEGFGAYRRFWKSDLTLDSTVFGLSVGLDLD